LTDGKVVAALLLVAVGGENTRKGERIGFFFGSVGIGGRREHKRGEREVGPIVSERKG
jgi:hypothetical protein